MLIVGSNQRLSDLSELILACGSKNEIKEVADAVDYKNCDAPQPDAISRRAKLTSGGFRQAQPTQEGCTW